MTTLKDIARACGVAPITVSDILNNKPGAASADTRERILRVAREMDYRPNTVARGLRQGRMNTVGVLLRYSGVPAISNPVAMMLLDSILAVNTRRNQSTTLVTVEDWPSESGLLQHSALSACDGVLLAVPPDCDALKPLLDRRRLPFVSIGCTSKNDDVAYVDVDNEIAVKSAITYLADRGHRKIAFLSEPSQEYRFVKERLDGFRLALQHLGLPNDPAWEFTGENCFTPLAEMFRRPAKERPTALFSATDFCAVTALTILSGDCGLKVPDDVSLMGYDDIAMTATLRPALTTVHQPFTEIGEAAAELLLDLIAGKSTPIRHVLLPTAVVERQSVAAPPSVA